VTTKLPESSLRKRLTARRNEDGVVMVPISSVRAHAPAQPKAAAGRKRQSLFGPG